MKFVFRILGIMYFIIVTGNVYAQHSGIKLETFSILGENEMSDDEPYMWVYGIVIDANTISNRQYVITVTNPGHENISKPAAIAAKYR